jgi:hypothetical protein
MSNYFDHTIGSAPIKKAGLHCELARKFRIDIFISMDEVHDKLYTLIINCKLLYFFRFENFMLNSEQWRLNAVISARSLRPEPFEVAQPFLLCDDQDPAKWRRRRSMRRMKQQPRGVVMVQASCEIAAQNASHSALL